VGVQVRVAVVEALGVGVTVAVAGTHLLYQRFVDLKIKEHLTRWNL